MKRNIVTKSEFPEPPYTTELASFHIPAVPTILGALALKSLPYWYASHDDWHRARKSLAYLGKELLMPSGRDIVNGINRVYTLLDAGLFGTERSVTGEGTDIDPFIYSPELAQARQPTPYTDTSLLGNSEATRSFVDNLATGTANDYVGDTRNFRQQLDDLILAAGSEESLDPEMLEQLIQIAALLA